MKFEELGGEQKHKHSLIFAEGDEVEAVASSYREYVAQMTLDGKFDELVDYQLDLSMWTEDQEQSVHVNDPEAIAKHLESFHDKTKIEAGKIADRLEVPFDSDAIARRKKMGKKALHLAGLIRGHYGIDELVREIDELDSALFTNGSDASA